MSLWVKVAHVVDAEIRRRKRRNKDVLTMCVSVLTIECLYVGGRDYMERQVKGRCCKVAGELSLS